MTAVAYQPVADVPREDYRDFVGKQIDDREVHAGVAIGVWPPGLLFQDAEGRVWLVWGQYGKQRLVSWTRNVRVR